MHGSVRWTNVRYTENLMKKHASFYSGSLGQDFSDPNDYFNVANHEVDQQEELEYEVGTPTNQNNPLHMITNNQQIKCR